MKYLKVLSKSKIFKDIDENNISSMLTCLDSKTKNYKKNEYILREGDFTGSICFILKGNVVISKIDFWGNQNVLSKLSPSDHFAESFAASKLKVAVDAIATSDCVIMFVPIASITKICSNACGYHIALMNNLMELIACKNIYLTSKISHMAKRTTKDKLMSYLMTMSKTKGSDTFTIPFNRQELADYLSVDRSAMSNELSKLRDDNILKFEKNHFEIIGK